MSRFLSTVVTFLFVTFAFADTIVMKNEADTLTDCVVLQETQANITVLHETGLLIIPRSLVQSVNKDSKQLSSKKQITSTRIADYRSIIVNLASQKWATDLRQIPATVIDTGILKNVPYKSHHAGIDYEINVYGDPGAPASFEIGIYRSLLNDEKARKNCIEFACSLLPEPSDCAILNALNLTQDSVSRNGLTFEITPPTAADAYGGWWVSIYNEKALDAVRASDEEMQSLTVAKSTSGTSPTPTVAPPVAKPTPQIANESSLESLSSWSTSDYSYSRKSTNSSSGRVYVRGYYRKDGTYVKPHTRSRRSRRH